MRSEVAGLGRPAFSLAGAGAVGRTGRKGLSAGEEAATQTRGLPPPTAIAFRRAATFMPNGGVATSGRGTGIALPSTPEGHT